MVTSKDIARRNYLQRLYESNIWSNKLNQKQEDELSALSMEIAYLPKEVYEKLLAEI